MEFRADTPQDVLIQIVAEKHEQIPGILHETNIDTWIIFVRETAANPDPVQNLVIGGDLVWESAIIFSNASGSFEKIAIVGNFDADAESNKSIWDRVIPYKEGISEHLRREIERLNPVKIALNYSTDDVVSDGLSHGMYLRLSEILKDYADRFVSAKGIIGKVRSRKTSTEIKLIHAAAELTEEINQSITRKLESGMTEIEIQKMFHDQMDDLRVLESWQRSSCPAVDAGPDKVMGHVGPSELRLRSGHTLHNDFGIKRHGYCSDIQRMWFLGNKDDIDPELDHAFKTVYGAITAASEFIKPGVKGWEVDKIARDHVLSQGYEEYAHALGHQVGTKAHDGGTLLGPKWERYGELPDGIIEKDQVYTFELYVKTENYGMVSLEEMIRVTDDGCEFIVPRQHDWILVAE